MKQFLGFIGLILSGIVLFWFLLTFVFVSDEQQILRTIERGRSSIVGGSVFSLNTILAMDYTHEGRVDRRTVIGGLRQLFQQTEDRRVLITDTTISIDGDAATAEVEFAFQAEASGSSPALRELMPDGGETRLVKLSFRKNGRSWEIIRSDL